MTDREIALEYLRCFCAGDTERLKRLLAPDLKFEGTLYSFYSSEEYLASLRSNPPERCQYNVFSITENTGSVAVFYLYQKPRRVMRIAQLFKIADQQIYEILLVFDGRELA